MKARILTLYMFLVLMSSVVFGIETVVIQPDANSGVDSYIEDNSPDANWDGYLWLQVGYLTTPVISTTRALIKFNLSEIPKNAIILEANLSLYWYFTSEDPGSSEFTVYRINESWNETNVTWNNQPDINTTIIDSIDGFQAGNEGQWKTWNVTNTVQEWINGTYENYGFEIRKVDENSGGTIRFYSSDYETADLRPKLVVTYKRILTGCANITESGIYYLQNDIIDSSVP